MLNVYEQVSANKLKSNIIIALFIIFISLAGYSIAYTIGLNGYYVFVALGFSVLASLASFYWGDQIVLTLNGARVADRKQFFDFFTATENLAMSVQIPNPKIYVIDSPAPNAFATGRDPQHAVVCVTTGLLSKLNRSQLEAVIAHEISHITNYDIRLMMIVSLLVGSLSILTNIAFHSRIGDSDDRDNRVNAIIMIIGIAMIFLAPIIAQLIQLAISRRREYLADASSVKLTRQPQSLIEALTIISQDKSKFTQASTATASLYISNPFQGNRLDSLFSTHPPIADRINTLKQML